MATDTTVYLVGVGVDPRLVYDWVSMAVIRLQSINRTTWWLDAGDWPNRRVNAYCFTVCLLSRMVATKKNKSQFAIHLSLVV